MNRYWLFLALAILSPGQVTGPDIRIYKTVGTTRLTAHIFRPQSNGATARPAIVLFHGGGWVAGSPEWVYDAAKRYVVYGAVAVAAEYRLSDQKTITPLDAMEDARDIMLWLRRNAAELGIQPDHIAAHGVSAGGQLAASLSTPASMPNALVLISPAVAVTHDGWFQKILLGRASSADLSPNEHVTGAFPPAAIFLGDSDILTPSKATIRFCDLVNERGGHCEIHVYPGVGHLFTRKLDNQEDNFDPDPKFVLDAREKGDQFLAARGFLKIDK
ncbi:MAG TPA: alpha/beta hydrolase [Bryobacteraceae bacterium]|nr:alpha/beta hydrolase [Bryobacteraceae bacterium]